MTVRAQPHLLTNHRYMRRVFARLVRRYYPRGTTIVSLKVKEVGSFRFKRALRYELGLKDPAGRPASVLVRGNVPSSDTQNEATVADRVQRALAKHGFAFGTLRSPVSFGVVAPLCLNLYEECPGLTLERLLRTNDKRAIVLVKDAGAWLAKLHQKKLGVSPKRTPDDNITEAAFFQDDVIRYAPRYSENMIRILGAAVQSQQYIVSNFSRTLRSIHGDLNLGNVLRGRDECTGFIDFGRSVVYDPLSDVGNFLAQLDFLAWEMPRLKREKKVLFAVFLKEYKRCVHNLGPRVAQRIGLHHAWWLLQILAYKLSTDAHFGRRVAGRALNATANLLAQNKFPVAPPLIEADRSTLRIALTDTAVMHGFFQNKLTSFFPDTQKVERITISQPHALSTTSFLTRYRLVIMLPDGRLVQKNVRGNYVSKETLRIMRATYHHTTEFFDTIRPLYFLTRPGYVLYEELSGESLRAVPIRSQRFIGLIRPIARALATFHSIPVTSIKRLSWNSEQALVHSNASRAMKGVRSGRHTIRNAYETLVQAERPIWSAHRAIVHNDFQASNIIQNAKKVGFIDFTMSGAGHPAIDVGNFLAHLTVMLYGKVGQRRVTALRKLFITEYLRWCRGIRRENFLSAVSVFELRGSLDILAITLTNLGTNDPNRRRYVGLLLRRFAELRCGIVPA
ncbi:MAG: aminoglycoside phosphotransferase family protein [Candidatus Kerfeldbacteria bacterium]